MITLNQDKELVRVSSWDDITQRPGFTAPLDPLQHKLKGIIGQYSFASDIPCGLSTCRTMHKNGYLVVTQSGHETNLGKDCGKNYFGVDFETMRNIYDRDYRAKEQRERLYSLQNQLDTWNKKLASVRAGAAGVDATWHKVRPFREIGKGVPNLVVQQLRSMLKAGTSILTIDRLATQEETERFEASQGRSVQRPHYVSQTLGEIQGLHALRDDMDLRSLFVLELEEPLSEFEKVIVETLSSNELNRYAKWVSGLDAHFKTAMESLGAACIFLNSANLAILSKILTKDEDREAYEKFLHSRFASEKP
jgi:hypothetical protein